MQHITASLDELKVFYENQVEDVNTQIETLTRQYEAKLAEQKARITALQERVIYVNILMSDLPPLKCEDAHLPPLEEEPHRDESNGKYIQQTIDVYPDDTQPSGSVIVQCDTAVPIVPIEVEEPDHIEECVNPVLAAEVEEPDYVEEKCVNPVLVTKREPDLALMAELFVKGNYRHIYNIMQSNRGKVLHINYIFSRICQSIEPRNETQAKKKLRAELAYGVKRGLWDKVPDEEACYMIGS